MPLYEYRCCQCDHRFEVLQRLDEGTDKLTCPQCGAPAPQKQFSTFASSAAGGAATVGGGGCGAGGGFT